MSEIPPTTDQSGSEAEAILSDDSQDSVCDDVITFSTGRVAALLGCVPATVRTLMDGGKIPSFHIPGSNDRRCTRNDLQCYLDEKGIDANLGAISQEFLDKRANILRLDNLSAENIAALLQVAPGTVRTWMNDLGLSSIMIGIHRRVLWPNLVSFLTDKKIPRELLYEYLPGASGAQPKKPPEWYSSSDVLDFFACHLCEGNRDHAQTKLNVLLETDGLRYEGDGKDPTRICGADVVAYMKKKGVDITA